MPTIDNRVKVTTTSTGTGNLVIDGPAPGFHEFAGGRYYYVLEEGAAYELGVGYIDGLTGEFVRETILQSSTGSAISLNGSGASLYSCIPRELFSDIASQLNKLNNAYGWSNCVAVTTDATPTPLERSTPGQLLMPEYPVPDTTFSTLDVDEGWPTTFIVHGYVAAVTDTGESKAWRVEYAMRNDGSVASILGTPTFTVLGATAGASSWALSADVLGGTLGRVLCTGQAGTTVKWEGTLHWVRAGA